MKYLKIAAWVFAVHLILVLAVGAFVWADRQSNPDSESELTWVIFFGLDAPMSMLLIPLGFLLPDEWGSLVNSALFAQLAGFLNWTAILLFAEYERSRLQRANPDRTVKKYVPFGSLYRGVLTRRVFDLSSRASRYEFWSILMLSGPLTFAFVAILGVFFTTVVHNPKITELLSRDVVFYAWVFPLLLTLVFVHVSAAIRRLHDLNLRGIFLLILLIPYVGWMIFLLLMILPTRNKNNRYGPDPRFELPPVIDKEHS